MLLVGIDSIPGSLLDIYFTDGSDAGREVPVPVLDATLEFYEELLPMPVPTPEPSETPGSRIRMPVSGAAASQTCRAISPRSGSRGPAR